MGLPLNAYVRYLLLPPFRALLCELEHRTRRVVRNTLHGAPDYIECRRRESTARECLPQRVLTPAGCGQLRIPAQVDPKFLGADLHREKRLSVSVTSHCVTDAQVISAYLLSVCPVDSCVPTVDVTRPKRRRDCLVFKTRITEHWEHALADTGASENFISEELAKFLGLELHLRKQALNVRLAEVYVRRC